MSDYKRSKTDLISHYPEFLQENLEFNAICNASNPEFDLVWERLRQIELNILPQTANEDGIAVYEEWLGLRTNPRLDLETRRAQVIAKLNETLPYTEIRLQRMLAAIVGWGHFHYERHGAFVRVTLLEDSYPAINPVIDMLERILPMNLHFEVVYGVEHECYVKSFSATKFFKIIETKVNRDDQIATVFMGSPYQKTKIIETK